jgi:hypothetical protein
VINRLDHLPESLEAETSVIHFRCDTCNFELDIDYLPREYVLEGGRTISMQQRHIWCKDCKKITVAEAFQQDPNEKKMVRRFRASHRRKLKQNEFEYDYQRELCQKWLSESLEFDRDFKEWLRRRSAPSCCLRCGNEDIVIPETRYADIRHPVCGGILKYTLTVWGGTFHCPEAHKYTINGALIAFGYRPPIFMGDEPKPLELWWGE